jgi:hypothetical protein
MSTSVLTLTYSSTLPTTSPTTTNVNYNVTLANDTGNITIPLTDRDVSTSLDLFGKQSTEYGQGFWANMIHLLENFNNEKEPRNPIVGQLWYTGKKLLVCTKNPTTLITDADYITKAKTFSSGAQWSEITTTPTVTSLTGTPTAAFILDKAYVDNRSVTMDTDPVLTNDDVPGKIWYDTNDNVCKILVNIAGTKTWKSINSISVSPTSPANNVIGQVWYDNTNNLLKISNGFIKDSSGNPTTQVDWIIVNNPVKKITQNNPTSNYTLTISDLGSNINTAKDITLSSTIGEGFYVTVFNKATTAINVTWSSPLVITVNGDTTVKTSPVTIPPKSLITVMYMSNTEILLKS